MIESSFKLSLDVAKVQKVTKNVEYIRACIFLP